MDNAYYFEPKRTPLQRLLRWMFPSQHLEAIDPPTGYTGEVTTHVDIVIDWRDRIRLLVSGRAHVEVRTLTQYHAGRVSSRSAFHVEPPRANP